MGSISLLRLPASGWRCVCVHGFCRAEERAVVVDRARLSLTRWRVTLVGGALPLSDVRAATGPARFFSTAHQGRTAATALSEGSSAALVEGGRGVLPRKDDVPAWCV